MQGLHYDRAAPQQLCLLMGLSQHRLARLAVEVNRGERDEMDELTEERPCHFHVVLQGRGVGVHADDRHPGAVFAQIHVVGDQPRLVRLDEGDQTLDGRLQLVERSLTNIRGVDIENRVRHSCRLPV